MKKLLSTILMFTVMTMTLSFTTGCTSSQVVAEVNTVLTEATNILVIADPSATWVPQLQAAVTALKSAEAGWQSGGAVQDVISALNTVVAITSVIPVTAAYSPLIDVLVAGIESVLVALEPAGTVSVAYAGRQNPHLGRVMLVHHAFHNRATEFKTAWNDTAKDHGLQGALIQ